MHNQEAYSPENEPGETSEFIKGLEKIVSPAELDVLKEDCPTNPEAPLAESAENIGKE